MIEPLDPVAQEQFDSLPKLVQDVIVNSNWQLSIRDIIQKFNLRIDQGGVIENEVSLVMLGFQDADDFLDNIMREAALTKDVALSLEREVNSVIFAPLRAALMVEMEKSSAPKTKEIPAPVPEETRDDILKQIEDPEEIALPKITPRPIVAPTPSVTPTEPTAPVAPAVSNKPKTDPYREPIE